MDRPVIYRKRYIPEETVNLKDDLLCYRDEHMLITRWNTIKPRNDIAGGISLYLPDKNWKISRITDAAGRLLHYYCDIIHTDYYKEKDEFIFTDLLVDVVVYPQGKYRVLDLDELGDALDASYIDAAAVSEALHAANGLIRCIEEGGFSHYTEIIDKYR